MKSMLGLLNRKKRLLRTRSRKFNRRKALMISGGVFLFLVVFGFIFVYLPYTRIKARGQEVVAAGREVKAAFVSNDIEQVKTKLGNVEVKFNSFQKEAKSVYWMRFIPILGWYVSDFKNGVEAGQHMLTAVDTTVTSIEPYADLIGFKKGTDTSFIEKPAEQRLQTAVLTLDKILKDVDGIAVEVDAARTNIDAINPNRYPKKFAGHEIRSKIKNGKDQFDGVASLFVDAKPFIKSLPDILGAKEDKTYLILFQNDKELRATGGFLTAYAIFEVKQGKFEVKRSDDIYTLDDSISVHPVAPQKILTYHKGVSKFFIRDSNISPDFPASVALFDSLYQKSNQKVDYDGIIAVDTQVLVDALKVLGDTQVRGTNFSANEDPRCDCPQVIYALLNDIDRPVNYIKTDRKGILGDMLYTLMQKALGFSPSHYWGKLSQDMMKNLQQKHIVMYMKDPKIQKSIEQLNFGGRVKNYDGDYLYINDVNFAGAKSNLFVQHTITSSATIANDGTVQREVVIEYKNPYKHSDCSLERGGLCLNATLRNWVRVYVPEGSKMVEFKGSEKPVQTYDEFNKTVFEGFLGIKPEGKATVTVTYTLPFKVANTKEYKLLVQKQPGTDAHSIIVILNNGKLGETTLLTDKEFKIQ